MEMDKGWAWVVLAASMGSMYLNGILTSFMGVVQTGLLRKYGESVTLTAWVGGLFVALVNFAAPLSSFVIGRYGCRTCCVVGGVLCLIGMSVSAFVTSIGQLFITYGLTAGIGVALTYSPSIVSIGFYFKKYLGLAAGISASSAAIGILSGSLIMQTFIEEYSVDGAFLLIGAMAFHHCLFGMLYRPTVFEKNTSEATIQREIIIGSELSLNSIRIQMTNSVSSLTGRHRQQDWAPLEAEVGLLSDVACDGISVTKTEDTAGEYCNEHIDKPELMEELPTIDDRSCQQIQPSQDQEKERDNEFIHSRKDERVKVVEEPRLVSTNRLRHYEDVKIKVNDDAASPVNTSLPQTQATSSDNYGDRSSLSGNGCQSTGVLDTGTPLSKPGNKCRVTQKTKSQLRPKESPEDCEENWSLSKERDLRSQSSATGDVRKPGNGQLGGNVTEVLQKKAFLCYCLNCLLSSFAFGGVYVHLPEYVQTLGTTPTAAASLFIAIGVMSLVSRLSTAIMTTEERIDPLVLHMGLTGLSGLVNLLFPLFADTYEGQMAYCALFGLYTGGLNAMFNVMTVRLVGVSLLNTGFGLLGIFLGVGFVTGPTFAALVVDMGGTYQQSFLLLGSTLEVAFLLDLAAGLFVKSDSQTEGDEVAVTDGDLMDSKVAMTDGDGMDSTHVIAASHSDVTGTSRQ